MLQESRSEDKRETFKTDLTGKIDTSDLTKTRRRQVSVDQIYIP